MENPKVEGIPEARANPEVLEMPGIVPGGGEEAGTDPAALGSGKNKVRPRFWNFSGPSAGNCWSRRELSVLARSLRLPGDILGVTFLGREGRGNGERICGINGENLWGEKICGINGKSEG